MVSARGFISRICSRWSGPPTSPPGGCGRHGMLSEVGSIDCCRLHAVHDLQRHDRLRNRIHPLGRQRAVCCAWRLVDRGSIPLGTSSTAIGRHPICRPERLKAIRAYAHAGSNCLGSRRLGLGRSHALGRGRGVRPLAGDCPALSARSSSMSPAAYSWVGFPPSWPNAGWGARMPGSAATSCVWRGRRLHRAYTTFSTFEWETHGLIRDGEIWAGLLYSIVSVVLGLIAVRLGVALGAAFKGFVRCISKANKSCSEFGCEIPITPAGRTRPTRWSNWPRREGLAGATQLRGIAGLDFDGQMFGGQRWSLVEHVPVIVELIDGRDAIGASCRASRGCAARRSDARTGARAGLSAEPRHGRCRPSRCRQDCRGRSRPFPRFLPRKSTPS